MAVAVLFSAGTDSALAATLLDPFYDVVACHCTFGIDAGDGSDRNPNFDIDPDPTETATAAATALGFLVETVELDEAVAREAVERMVADGYPRRGIQRVHEHALETVADLETVGGSRGADGAPGTPRPVETVADGTRRDDRVPTVDRAFAQSLEDRHGINYVRPLLGYGRGAIDDLADRLLTAEAGPSENVATGDYETELRALVAAEHGRETVEEVFPDHVQSRVTGRRA